MSRLHRAIEKADREGLLTWTRPVEPDARHRPEDERPADPPHVRPRVIDSAEPAAPWLHVAAAPRVVESTAFSPLLVAATEPGSAAAEQFRLLRTRLEACEATRRVQVLLVTSPRLGDGKTVTSANLALTMARELEHPVLLMETDLRRASIAERFGLRPEAGLAEVLAGTAALEDALVMVPGCDLTLLPAGNPPGGSTELLASSMMQETLEALRARFGRIVVDAPPAMLADTHVLARLADGILMVVRSGATPRPALERALEALDRERLLGIVLNDVESAADGYSYADRASDGQWT